MTDVSGNIGLDPEIIRTWLVDRVARYLGEPAATIDSGLPLSYLGLDSVYAFVLCGEIEDAYGRSVEPALLWKLETLDALAAHLAQVATRG